MCGIFAYTGARKNAPQLVLEGLKSLEYRGYDSWGIGSINGNTISVKKEVGKIGNATTEGLSSLSSCVFGHTRWATHGGITTQNAHPHVDCTKQIVLIHNGIVENYESLKKELIIKKHTFVSETDSEVVVHLIEDYRKKHTLGESIRKAFLRCKGLNAFIVLETNSNTIFAVKNGSPLVVGFGKNENFIASDAAALLPHTRSVYFVEDENFLEMNPSTVLVRNTRTNKILTAKKQILDWKVTQTEKGIFPYFMLKEIHEQAPLLFNIAHSPLSNIDILAEQTRKAHGVFLVACGTAAYGCIAGSYFFSKIAKCQVSWSVASEFGYQLDFLNKKSLVIALSQSGETMDTLEAIKKAKEKGSTIGTLVNAFGSTLYREANYNVLVGAGPEKSVASTKAFTAQLAYLILLAYAFINNGNQGQKIIAKASHSVQLLLKRQTINKIKECAKILSTARDIYIVGRGLSYPASLEAALKIKEISYIHAEGFAAGELKHGVLALIEKGTPCIVFLPNDETYGANLAGAMEMKARGGFIIGISYKPHEVFDDYINVKDAEIATIIPNVVVAQLLAYYITIEKGLDPDMPRNLAKSVTVK